ncbi:protein of unknown function [Methylocaldum szegediense]|uniref:Uncharacterized protein n=1 Tax=Methylocaldum szegediense TaxID=73780 RepID=A0ABN8XC65_9GAMM|nr:protein of unknown function [Methylocaldum szegediense]
MERLFRLFGFNPLPVIKPGVTGVLELDLRRLKVSIHSRLLSRELRPDRAGRRLAAFVSIHSRLLSRELPTTMSSNIRPTTSFNPLPVIKPGVT